MTRRIEVVLDENSADSANLGRSILRSRHGLESSVEEWSQDTLDKMFEAGAIDREEHSLGVT